MTNLDTRVLNTLDFYVQHPRPKIQYVWSTFGSILGYECALKSKHLDPGSKNQWLTPPGILSSAFRFPDTVFRSWIQGEGEHSWIQDCSQKHPPCTNPPKKKTQMIFAEMMDCTPMLNATVKDKQHRATVCENMSERGHPGGRSKYVQ